MILYQNFAYCRYIFVWTFLFLFNIVPYSPTGSLCIIIFINYFYNQSKKIMTKNKFNGMIISEIILLFLCLIKVFKFYWIENTIFFTTYCGLIYFGVGVNPLYLHTTLLAEDDEIYKDELYFPYMKRVWSYFIFFYKDHHHSL